MRALALALVVALTACGGEDPGVPDAFLWPTPSWPPTGGAPGSCPYPFGTGVPCGPHSGWCHDCDRMIGCWCDGATYHCFDADSVCDFGEGVGCAIEGNPNCDTPPAPQYCTCTEGNPDCRAVCPLAECPDYDAGTSACTCADGSCP